MFHGYYIIWALLPVGLWALTIWAFVKPALGVSGHEDGKDYLKQAIFVLIGFLIALFLDDSLVTNLIESTPLGTFESTGMVAHWLFFPFVLLVMAYLSRAVRKWRGLDPKEDVAYGLARYRR